MGAITPLFPLHEPHQPILCNRYRRGRLLREAHLSGRDWRCRQAHEDALGRSGLAEAPPVARCGHPTMQSHESSRMSTASSPRPVSHSVVEYSDCIDVVCLNELAYGFALVHGDRQILRTYQSGPPLADTFVLSLPYSVCELARWARNVWANQSSSRWAEAACR